MLSPLSRHYVPPPLFLTRPFDACPVPKAALAPLAPARSRANADELTLALPARRWTFVAIPHPLTTLNGARHTTMPSIRLTFAVKPRAARECVSRVRAKSGRSLLTPVPVLPFVVRSPDCRQRFSIWPTPALVPPCTGDGPVAAVPDHGLSRSCDGT
eukprot:scaffold4434_cov109-Isochrysis_galbana.AAC.7